MASCRCGGAELNWQPLSLRAIQVHRPARDSAPKAENQSRRLGPWHDAGPSRPPVRWALGSLPSGARPLCEQEGAEGSIWAGPAATA